MDSITVGLKRSGPVEGRQRRAVNDRYAGRIKIRAAGRDRVGKVAEVNGKDRYA